MATELTNQIGECDFASLYLYRRLLDAWWLTYKTPLNFAIHSTDTDMCVLMLFMMALDKTHGSQIWWEREKKSWVFQTSREAAPSTNEKWVDLNSLYDCIQNMRIDASDHNTKFYQNVMKQHVTPADIDKASKILRKEKQVVLNFASILLFAGGDYTIKIPNLIVDRYVTAFLKSPADFCNIFSVKLIQGKGWDVVVNSQKLFDLIARTKEFAPRAVKIDTGSLLVVVGKLVYCIRLYVQAGDNKMALYESDIMPHGYGADPAKRNQLTRRDVFTKTQYQLTDAQELAQREKKKRERIEKGKERKQKASKKALKDAEREAEDEEDL